MTAAETPRHAADGLSEQITAKASSASGTMPAPGDWAAAGMQRTGNSRMPAATRSGNDFRSARSMGFKRPRRKMADAGAAAGKRGRETVSPSAENLSVGERRASRDKLVTVQLGVILILASVYFLQAATPLRLHPDTVVFLLVAEAAERGGGFLYHGQPTVFPPGYPALLALLIRAHLAHVWVVVTLSVVFLALGLLAIRNICKSEGFSERVALGICILSMLSFVFIKYSAIPLSDALFFGLSAWCLAAMKTASSRFSLRRAIASVVLLVASVCVRRIGITLIPALLYMLIFRRDALLYAARLSVRMKGAAVLLAASCAAGIAWAVRTTSTLRDFKAALEGRAAMEAALGILALRLKELGEIALNVPTAALPPIVQGVLPFVGAVVFSLACGGVASRRKQFGVVEAYFIAYVGVILIWPFYDPRFWLPVIPFLIAYSGLSLWRLIQGAIAQEIFGAYVILFSVLGLVALAASTSLSFSGSKFPDEYAYREFHATYCAAWHCEGKFDATKVDQDGLYLLRRYK